MAKSYIDIHSHILPGLDDGPEIMEESIRMARIAQKNGIFRLIATPHNNEYHQPSKKVILDKLTAVNKELLEKDIPVEIFPGNELKIAENLSEVLYGGSVLSLAGSKYVLIEFPFSNIPIYSAGVIMDLTNNGWRPILAHPERIYDIQQNSKLLKHYIDSGCIVQVNSNSITGELGRSSRKSGIELLKLGYVDIIASDAHSAHGRIPDFFRVLKAVSRIVGKTKAVAMVSETPEKILKDLEI